MKYMVHTVALNQYLLYFSNSYKVQKVEQHNCIDVFILPVETQLLQLK